MAAIKQALISVSDKSGVLEFAQGLHQLGIKILSTGGTAKLLADNGVPVTEVADYTGFPEMLDGRVKTLQPKVHAGILARRDVPEHVATLNKHNIPTIDLVVVNLYPFSATVAKPDCTLEDAIENIDIGGPTMVRAAAKNHAHVAIVTDPLDYPDILAEMQTNNSAASDATRFDLAKKAFSHTAAYDSAISNYLTAINADGTRSAYPAQINFNFAKVQDMRYGENPHQSAAFYRDLNAVKGGIADYTQVQGKELSYNNIGDADAAWECVKLLSSPPASSSNMPTPAVWQLRTPRLTPTNWLTQPIPPPPSAASSPSIVNWMQPLLRSLPPTNLSKLSLRHRQARPHSRLLRPNKTYAYSPCLCPMHTTRSISNVSTAACWCNHPMR